MPSKAARKCWRKFIFFWDSSKEWKKAGKNNNTHKRTGHWNWKGLWAACCKYCTSARHSSSCTNSKQNSSNISSAAETKARAEANASSLKLQIEGKWQKSALKDALASRGPPIHHPSLATQLPPTAQPLPPFSNLLMCGIVWQPCKSRLHLILLVSCHRKLAPELRNGLLRYCPVPYTCPCTYPWSWSRSWWVWRLVHACLPLH